MKPITKRAVFIIAVTAALTAGAAGRSQQEFEGAEWIDSHGYKGCVLLSNRSTRAVLEPNCGGRIIEYSIDGANVLYVDPEQDGWTYTEGEKGINPSGGRFDIGPEMKAPRRPNFWLGRWKAEITGPRTARMTSVADEATGVRLVREFTLDSETSYLRCTQIITNTSRETKSYNHWSRTFAEGGGICVVPLSQQSRFPLGYVIYGPGAVLNYRHEPHENVRVRDGYLEIPGPPPQKKFGVDSYAGWLGYITRSNLLFVKKFPVYPDRAYGEVAAYTISIWYDREVVCELEPIGPTETLAPGESASFTEDWWLFPYGYPASGEKADLAALGGFVKENARSVVTPGTKVQKLAGGYTWAEGPAEDAAGTIYFTDNRENLIHVWKSDGTASVFLKDAHRANGMYRDRDGRIIACAGSPKQIVAMDGTGAMTVIADSYDGKPFNAPNDLWIDPKGGIYFTDPYWGKEQGRSRVYYLAPDRTTLTPVILDMVKPNGVIGSPDGKRLYVSDWVEKKTYAFNISDDGTVWRKRLFAPVGDDGMTVDTEGNVYLTGDAVTVYDPNGVRIDTIEVPETPANVIFSGADKHTLFITARTSIFSIRLRTRGL